MAVEADSIIWAPCVCSLTSIGSYEKAIETYNDLVWQNKFDSVISAKLFKEYLWDEKAPLNYTLGKAHVISQNLPDWHTIVDRFYIDKREDMIKWKYWLKLPLEKPVPPIKETCKPTLLQRIFSVRNEDSQKFARILGG